MNCASFCMHLLNPALVITDFYLNDAKQPPSRMHILLGLLPMLFYLALPTFCEKRKTAKNGHLTVLAKTIAWPTAACYFRIKFRKKDSDQGMISMCSERWDD